MQRDHPDRSQTRAPILAVSTVSNAWTTPAHRSHDCLIAAAALLPSLYIFLNTNRVYDRSAFLDPVSGVELVLGTVVVLLIMEAVRRALSAVLTVLIALVIAYLLVSSYLPGAWCSRHLPFGQIVEIMYVIPGSGLYGRLTGISATILAAFLAFGAFLQESGMGRLFMNFGSVVAGRFVGGPAKVAVVSSALFGSMNDSAVANVVVTGTITIPTMKRIGFRPAVASGVEAASSVGGLIMPPLMGAAAFVMAEIISLPYIEIAVAAALAAVLYYLGILLTVHFESKRLGIAPMPHEELPTARDLLRDAHLALPVVVLVTLLAMGFSAYLAAFWSTGAIVAASWLRAHTRMGPRQILLAFASAGRTIAVLAVAVTAAGLIMARSPIPGCCSRSAASSARSPATRSR
jgi:TRAP transporter 4TM/12TM fusion protein